MFLVWSEPVFCANSWEAQSGTLKACLLSRPSGSSSSKWRGRTSVTSTSASYHRCGTLLTKETENRRITASVWFQTIVALILSRKWAYFSLVLLFCRALYFITPSKWQKRNDISHTQFELNLLLLVQPHTTGEQKTKPTQSSVRELRGLGLTPDLVSQVTG